MNQREKLITKVACYKYLTEKSGVCIAHLRKVTNPTELYSKLANIEDRLRIEKDSKENLLFSKQVILILKSTKFTHALHAAANMNWRDRLAMFI
jgi:hypothetical protein